LLSQERVVAALLRWTISCRQKPFEMAQWH
jgi:hypothetical protein